MEMRSCERKTSFLTAKSPFQMSLKFVFLMSESEFSRSLALFKTYVFIVDVAEVI